ncbi:MAG: prohibitin family protein [Deltaproteobacteria bacterium]|nr:prohibitin family protein [Deltaproteobacteria bacterium]
MNSFSLIPVSILAALMAVPQLACTVVKQGEVGVQRTLGRYEDRANKGGIEFYNPLLATVVKVPVRTVNLEVASRLPSAPTLLRTIGRRYERNLILPVFRSAVADVSAQFLAKDMHTGARSRIEVAIRERMVANLAARGIEVEAVLIKSIQLPNNLARAIEAKLEAERRRIEAEGVRNAQTIIAEGLTPAILQFKSIEAFLELSKSPNSKVIITDGDMPTIMPVPSAPAATPAPRPALAGEAR